MYPGWSSSTSERCKEMLVLSGRWWELVFVFSPDSSSTSTIRVINIGAYLISCPLQSHRRHAQAMSTDTHTHTRIYLVRHGQTEENKRLIIQGHLDTILNSEGEKQADLVGKALKDVPFDVCYSSNLKRATVTAKRIVAYHSGVEVQTHIAIRERVRKGIV